MGRGVFTRRRFRKGEIIDICPVIPLTPAEASTCSPTILDDYFFQWGPGGKGYALALGYGSLFNHSAEPNASFACRLRQLWIEFQATRDIAKGEQITIDYEWPDMTKMPRSRVGRRAGERGSAGMAGPAGGAVGGGTCRPAGMHSTEPARVDSRRLLWSRRPDLPRPEGRVRCPPTGPACSSTDLWAVAARREWACLRDGRTAPLLEPRFNGFTRANGIAERGQSGHKSGDRNLPRRPGANRSGDRLPAATTNRTRCPPPSQCSCSQGRWD